MTENDGKKPTGLRVDSRFVKCAQTGIKKESSDTSELETVGMKHAEIAIDEKGILTGEEAKESGAPSINPLPMYDRSGRKEEVSEVDYTPLAYLLKSANSDWESNTTDSDLRNDEKGDTDGDFGSTVVSVPGGYSRRDTERLLRTISASGFNELVGVARSPVSTAAAYQSLVKEEHEETEAVVLNVGEEWFNIALITITEDGEYITHSRRSEFGEGRQKLERSVAAWAVEKAADEAGKDIQYTEDGMRKVVEEISEAMDTLKHESSSTVSVESETTSASGEPIEVNVEMDEPLLFDVLKQETKTLVNLVRDFVESLDESKNPDRIILSGPGLSVPTVKKSIGDAVEIPVSEPGLKLTEGKAQADVETVGAAVIASQYSDEGHLPIRKKTLYHDVCLDVVTKEGIERLTLAPANQTSEGEVLNKMIKTSIEDQMSAKLRLTERHRLSGWEQELHTYTVRGIPPKPAGEVKMEITLDIQDVNIGGADGYEIQVRVKSSSGEEKLKVSEENPEDEPALPAHAEADTAELEVEYEEIDSSLIRPEDDISTESVVESVHEIRNELWKITEEDSDEPLDRKEIELMVRKFDNVLGRHSVEVIQPQEGDEFDEKAHRIIQVRDTEMPENEIVEVTRPGYKIDGKVSEPASVVLSSGPSSGEQ